MRHRITLSATYGPEELFRALKEVGKRHRAEFQFDWIARRVAFMGVHAAAAMDDLCSTVAKGAGPGQILPGKPVARAEGRTEIPAGILLQSPDAFAEMIAQLLTELGIPGITLENEGRTLSIPLGAATKVLDHRAIVKGFPLPPYVRMEEES